MINGNQVDYHSFVFWGGLRKYKVSFVLKSYKTNERFLIHPKGNRIEGCEYHRTK